MIAEVALPTLLEDWRARREQLRSELGKPRNHAAVLIKVLDYLIQRYEGTDVATETVRATPLPRTYLNSRAMVVHHHAWEGVVAGVKNRGEAQGRISLILQRMGELSSRRASDQGVDVSSDDSGMGEVQGVNMARRVARERFLSYALAFRMGERWAIQRCLSVSPYLPDRAVRYLAACAGLVCACDTKAVALLTRCANPLVCELASKALAKRVEKTDSDAVTEALAALLRNPVLQKRYYPNSVATTLSRIRQRLASEDPGERRRTIRVLALIGDVQDIGLLADVAAVCEPDEAAAGERAAILAAMEEIARRPAD